MPRQKLTKRDDGRFRCKYQGKLFYGTTQAEAMKKRDDWIRQEHLGFNHSTENTTFLDYCQQWVGVYRTDCGSAQQKQYFNMMTYAATNVGKAMIKDITATDLQALCNTMSSYSTSYVSKFMTTLRGVFRTAVSDGAILRNPMDGVKRPKTKKCEGHRALAPWERELIAATYQGHDFGLMAMTMMFAGLRRGEALSIDIDRDVDFEARTLTVRQALSFPSGNQPVVTAGKTCAAQRKIPLVEPLAKALKGHHGLLCTKEDGGLMTETAFKRKYDSYLAYLETTINGCQKRWYGKTKAHKALLSEGKELPPWKEVNIRCHDFRVDFCTQAYEAGIPVKTLQAWMGHRDHTMIMAVYTKLSQEREEKDALRLAVFMSEKMTPDRSASLPATPQILGVARQKNLTPFDPQGSVIGRDNR